MISVNISPIVRKQAVGGISRVIEAQLKYLPSYDIEICSDPKYADILAVHAATWVPPLAHQRVVTHCHGLYWSGYEWGSKWYQQTNSQVIDAMRQADVVTVPSEWVANSVRHGTWLQPRVIGHGIDLDEWQGSSSNQHNGYILWDKFRVDPICDPRPVNVLASAMPKIKFRSTFGDNAQNVQIIGETPYQDHKSNITNAMLYLSTTRETFGISVLEAMASGVPIVGWNWGGQKDIVTKETGWLSTPGDYEDLIRGINFCIEHRQQMSQACRQLVTSKYQWKDVIGQYADLYHSLVSEISPRVNVIIPSYNLEQYLGQAIQSVLNQDYDNYEIIVVDDCSTDGSYTLAKHFEESYEQVHVYKTPTNKYLAGALNYGIERASGEYILPLDADNILAPGTLRTLAESLDSDRSLDICYGKVKFITEDGLPDRSVAGDGISSWPPKEFNYDAQMAHKNQIPSTSMYRRKLWSRVGGYRQRCRTAEDADFWCRATTFGATARRVTDAVTLVYRNRESSMSHVEPSWPWEAWYSWAGKTDLTPYINAYRDNIPVSTFEPILVSIIIPVGPGHETQGLQDALDSVYSQSVQNWECIVVNDTGDKLLWVPSWARVEWTGGRAKGVSKARNIGLANMNPVSSYFVFLDADDYLDPEFLAKTIIAQNKYGGYVYTDFFKNNDTVVSIDAFECRDQLSNLRHPITCLYPSIVAQKCKFDETMTYGEDWDYILNVTSSGWCGTHVKVPLVYYRQSSGNNRRALVTNISEVRQKLQNRWGTNMADCGCRGGGGNVVIDNTLPIQEAAMQGELVLLEFVKPGITTMSWTGPSTGHNYRFGSDQGHRISYVHRADAMEFIKRPEFELASLG